MEGTKSQNKRESVHPVAISRLKATDKKKQIMYRETLNMVEINIIKLVEGSVLPFVPLFLWY